MTSHSLSFGHTVSRLALFSKRHDVRQHLGKRLQPPAHKTISTFGARRHIGARISSSRQIPSSRQHQGSKIRADCSVQDSAVFDSGRASPSVRAAGAGKYGHPLERGSGSALETSAKICRCGRERMSRHQHGERWAVIERASERSGEARCWIDVPAGSHGPGLRGPGPREHGATVRAVPAAARGQGRVRAAVDEGRQWPQPEEQGQKNGEAAPHLHIMLADTKRDPAAGDKKVTRFSPSLNGMNC